MINKNQGICLAETKVNTIDNSKTGGKTNEREAIVIHSGAVANVDELLPLLSLSLSHGRLEYSELRM